MPALPRYAGRCLLTLALLAAAVLTTPRAGGETLRVAVLDTSLSGRAPGRALRALQRNGDRHVQALLAVIVAARPDILVAGGLDWDADLATIRRFQTRLIAAGLALPHLYAPWQAGGVPSGLDLDHDGQLHGASDALAWGRFPGADALAVLSRYPIDAAASRDFGAVLWADAAPDLLPRRADGGHQLPPRARARLPLSGHGPFDVAVTLPCAGTVRLLVIHATPPAFGVVQGANVLRNRAQLRFLARYLAGARATDRAGRSAPMNGALLALAGILNADPSDGGGRQAAAALLATPQLQDPRPRSLGAVAAARRQGGANARQTGDPALDTADWRDAGGGPGNLRVDYVLPARSLRVVDSGVLWPETGRLAEAAQAASSHRLVWADIETDPADTTDCGSSAHHPPR